MPKDFKWSAADKKTARRLYDAALAAELSEVLADFKARAAAADVQAMWAIGDDLRRARRELDQKYAYTCSSLDWLLVRLLRERRLSDADLEHFSPTLRQQLRDWVSFIR